MRMTSFTFNRKRIVLGIVFFLFFSIIALWIIIEPKAFIRKVFMVQEYALLLGSFQLTYSLLMIYAYISLLLSKKEALVIRDSCLVDNSRFESLGKINFDEISEVKKFKKNSILITLKKPILKRRISTLKKIVLIMNSWKTKNSIVISTALLHNCNQDTLEKLILQAIKKKK